MSAGDPPDFADACRLLFTIRIGGAEFPADVPALDAWMAARQWPDDTIAAYQKARRKAVEAYAANDGSDALAERIEEMHRIVHLLRALPAAKRGAPFVRNFRKPGTIGPVRKFVRGYLKKHPKAKASQVWDAIKAKPPRGVDVYEASGRVAPYITTAGSLDTSYARFANIVSEERPK